MGKWQNDDMLDAALSYIKTNCAEITLCNGQPSNYSDATTYGSGGMMLVTTALASTDVVLGDATSGRKAVVAQKSDITVSNTDDATHVAICSATELLYVTVCVSQSVTSGNLVTIPSWEIEMRDAM